MVACSGGEQQPHQHLTPGFPPELGFLQRTHLSIPNTRWLTIHHELIHVKDDQLYHGVPWLASFSDDGCCVRQILPSPCLERVLAVPRSQMQLPDKKNASYVVVVYWARNQ